MNNERRKELKEIASFAYETVPLYSKLAEQNNFCIEDMPFEKLPIVDKSYYAGSASRGISAKSIGDYITKKLQRVFTSGSTGKCTEIYWKEEDTARSLLSLWLLRRKYYGISAKDKLVYFYPALHNLPGQDAQIRVKNAVAFSKEYVFNGKLEEAYEQILQINPAWMIVQPSTALLLGNIAQKTGKIPKALRYIEFTGEYLEPALQKKTEKIFRCKSANQYGTKEVNSIAYECPEGNMHVMSDNVYLETVQRGSDKELCVTTLRNHVMPLVRFNIEDKGEILRNVSCKCGRCGDILKLHMGRSNEWIQNEDGTQMHAYALMQIVQQINYMTDGAILQYQLRQRDYRDFLVKLIVDSEYEDWEFQELANQIRDAFQERLGKEVQTEVIRVANILPDERSGKLACFLSDVM